MKRKEKSSRFDILKHRFPTVRRYRADLEDILEISKTRGFNVRISDDDYEYETLDELREQRGDRVLKVVLNVSPDNSSYSAVSIEIEKDGVTVRSQRDDNLVSLWHEIKDLLAKRVPWYARLMSPLGWALIASVWLWNGPKRHELSTFPPFLISIWFAFLFFSVSMSIFSFWYQRTNRGVYLLREHEVLGFWDRYGEKISMIVLGAVLGVLGKIAMDFIAGKCVL